MPSEEETIRQILRERGHDAAAGADRPLGANGIGLDSISLVELLLEIDARFGVALAESLLQDDALTIGAIARAVRRARSA